jgi:hypothetical protein
VHARVAGALPVPELTRSADVKLNWQAYLSDSVAGFSQATNRLAALPKLILTCSQRSIAMAQSTKPPIFDVIDIEREIEEEFRKQPSAREAQPADFAALSVNARIYRCPTMSSTASVPRRSASCRRKQ